MKENINVLEYSTQIMNQLNSGVLLTTKNQEKVNSMTISWGSLTIIWGNPHFVVYVRENRFTKHVLDETKEFTINIGNENTDKKILGYCGTKSGRDCDKIKDLNLELVSAEKIDVPAIKQLPLTLECKVVYTQLLDKDAIEDKTKEKSYPQDVDSLFHGANKDFHTAYYGEIVSSYIIK